MQHKIQQSSLLNKLKSKQQRQKRHTHDILFCHFCHFTMMELLKVFNAVEPPLLEVA